MSKIIQLQDGNENVYPTIKNIKVLWETDDITAKEAFTVNLSDSIENYSYIIFVVSYTTARLMPQTFIFKPSELKSNVEKKLLCSGWALNGRDITSVTNTSISFSMGYYYSTYNASTEQPTNSKYNAIPIKIIGVRMDD